MSVFIHRVIVWHVPARRSLMIQTTHLLIMKLIRFTFLRSSG